MRTYISWNKFAPIIDANHGPISAHCHTLQHDSKPVCCCHLLSGKRIENVLELFWRPFLAITTSLNITQFPSPLSRHTTLTHPSGFRTLFCLLRMHLHANVSTNSLLCILLSIASNLNIGLSIVIIKVTALHHMVHTIDLNATCNKRYH